MTDAPQKGVIPLLTAQAIALGVTCALLVVPANSIFLNAYGSKWLPATYIAIAVVGSGASALIARAARRTQLVRVATSESLRSGRPIRRVVADPRCRRSLDVCVSPCALPDRASGGIRLYRRAGRPAARCAPMKERFPRVIGGFVVGFLLGGLLGIPLLALLGSTEQLLLGTTAAQIVFLGLRSSLSAGFPKLRQPSFLDWPRSPVRRRGRCLLQGSSFSSQYQFLSAMDRGCSTSCSSTAPKPNTAATI